MFEKFALNTVLGFLGRAWPYILIGLLTAAVVWTGNDLGNARDKIAGEVSFRQALAHVIGSNGDGTSHLLYVAGARMTESEHRRAALVTISTEAVQAKQRSDKADAALKVEQEANAHKFAAAQRQIAALQARKPTGNAATDNATLEQDTQAAWKDWK